LSAVHQRPLSKSRTAVRFRGDDGVYLRRGRGTVATILAASVAIFATFPAAAQAPGERSAVYPLDCDRTCLIGFARSYMAALKAHKPGDAPLAKGVVFTSALDDTVNDTNGDGSATTPEPGNWQGIYFYASTNDATARLEQNDHAEKDPCGEKQSVGGWRHRHRVHA